MKPLIVLTAFPQGWIGRERPLLRGGTVRVKIALLPRQPTPFPPPCYSTGGRLWLEFH